MRARTIIPFITLILCTIFLSTSCTRPEGDIGDWFGSWYLEEMLINGEPDEEYMDDKASEEKMQVMVSFQGNIFNMGYLNGNHIYGVWSYAGEILTLNASYHAGGGYQDERFDPFPKVLHLPGGVEQVEITVTTISNRTMQWQYIDQNGDLITYNFKKYP